MCDLEQSHYVSVVTGEKAKGTDGTCMLCMCVLLRVCKHSHMCLSFSVHAIECAILCVCVCNCVHISVCKEKHLH